MIKVRLVGGPWDGEITEFERELPVITLPETEFSKKGLHTKRVHTYLTKVIKGKGQTYYIAIHDSLTMSQGMTKVFYETNEDREASRRVPGQENYRGSPR